MKSVADGLADTRWYIEAHGWTRGVTKNNRGEVCTFGGMLGSLGITNTESWQRSRYYPLLVGMFAAINEVTEWHEDQKHFHDDSGVFDLTGWNDRIAKNMQEVLDTIAKAEKIQRAGFDPDAP
jgi:hypothetical protein